MNHIYAVLVVLYLIFLLVMFFIALSVPFIAWIKSSERLPKTLRKRLFYFGRMVVWVFWPMALMGLGIKYIFELDW